MRNFWKFVDVREISDTFSDFLSDTMEANNSITFGNKFLFDDLPFYSNNVSVKSFEDN